jgi:FemAB-related protein (PEP-CTERM system-associated)
MSVAVKPLTAASAPSWDRFVAAMPTGTFFHRATWADVLSRAFNHTSLHAFVERDGAITGVLPLVHVKTALFGNTLISSPFCVYGGPLAADAESFAALDAYAASALQRSGASALELRFRDSPDPAALPGEWQAKDDLYVTFRKPIVAEDDANMKAIPRKQRAMVRKGLDRGLTSAVDRNVERLHAIYAESVRNLGTPVFSLRYFRILAEAFADSMDVLTVFDQDRAVAAVLNFYDRNEVLPYYGGGTAAARGIAANDFMYWEVLRRAAARGARSFDFGRSKVGTGAFAFKKNWGFSPQPLLHRFRLKPGAAVPDHNPLNPKYRMFISAWKRLPLPIANRLGPIIVRGVG